MPVVSFRVEKGSEEVRLMRAPSPEHQHPAVQQQQQQDQEEQLELQLDIPSEPSTSDGGQTEPDTTDNRQENADLLAQSLR